MVSARSQITDHQREVQAVAQVLYTRGSIHESVALVRGAKARDPGARFYAELLDALVAGDAPQNPGVTAELDLRLVDTWIRRGMLVEALALLGGTSLGTAETGQEWANLLGELLAPVPVDAEPTLVEMHRQLLTGGATVALTLLEDRAKREPSLPAWAMRRLDLLRWMLLDNARTAEPDATPDDAPPTELARVIREPLAVRSIRGAAAAASEYAAGRPDDRDAARAAEALANLVGEIERQAAKAQENQRTIPMYGAPAAAMQLRMGNIEVAGSVYERLLAESPEDADRLRLLKADVDAVLAAMSGRSLTEDELVGEPTTQIATHTGERAIPVTSTSGLPQVPEAAAPPERSGMMAVRAGDEGPTLETPDAATSASELEASGRFAEAEAIYRGLAGTDPGDPRWPEAAARCRRLMDRPATRRDVLVRAIVRVS